MTERVLPNQDLYVDNIKGWSKETGIRVIKEISEKLFILKCGGFQLRTELMNQTDKTLNAIQVIVIFSSRQNKEITDEIKEQFDELLLIIMDYWHEYATLNDYESVLLVDYFNDCELEPIFQSDTDEEEPREDVIRFLFSYPMLQQGRLLGARISKNIECKIQKFLITKSFLEQALSTNPLIRIIPKLNSNNIDSLIRKNASILVEYEDWQFFLTLIDDYQTLMFYTLNENKEQEVLLISPVNNSKNAVEKVIEQIKEENKLKHLVKPPMKHFKNFFSKHGNSLSSYEHYKHEFDSLLSILGDWEQVESEFIFLNKRNKLDCTVDSYDSIRKSRIRVHECKSKLYRYFFVAYKIETDKGEKYECSIIVSKDLQGSSEELQNKLQQLFIKGL
ncbi:hypothetical protein [Bacillus cereus group sp. TH152-1LC]|uniref:hypothetical protein n=1 Tax=Bacillus cereus group sp. TH152-1LC TaxID=3018060 RepID=UPI0022E01875|nr:hypothetical protein [Bacillus cereus group sp. TH152-1LC]MDA1675390.1 hypothetical protein [Bacillus cereus group sp. TH152-1LC]